MLAIKKGSTHTQADHVSCIDNGESPLGVNDKLSNAALFQIEMVPKWSERVVHFLTTTKIKNLGEILEEKR